MGIDNELLEKIYTIMCVARNGSSIDLNDAESVEMIKDQAKEVVSFLYPEEKNKSSIKFKNPGSIDADYKSMLNHLVGAHGLPQPEYETILSEKTKGKPIFACCCSIDDGENIYESEYMKGNSKKHAQKAAAMDLYNKLPNWIKDY